MNLCASWYPVLIVEDDSFFSAPSLAFVFGTSARARAGAGAGAACTDDEELEAPLPFFDRFFFNFSGGVVTTQIKKPTINQKSVIITSFFATRGTWQ
jgi:hypothetical protein